jgi:tetratricopeptide (TPR) repeat protein
VTGQAPERGREATAAKPAAGPPSNEPNRGSERFRGWRGWLLRLALVVLSPLLFFGLLEAGLRVGGYGYPTGFFLGPDASGNYTTNNRFGWRFFPRSMARDPQPCVLAAKPAGAIRIFVLGSSAAMGTPDPALSFGRILEVLLREQYPGVKFEVVNAAMTAINSHVAREIARDCAGREPDLFVLYMGNNEVVGPYGPGTVFQRWSPSLPMIRANLWIKSTRTGQLLGAVAVALHRNPAPSGSWRGMEMFLNNPVPADDPRLISVYASFRQNLTDICALARRAHAGVILSTVAVNLRDCPPFASRHQSDLTPANLAKWESIYQAGAALEVSNRWPEALEQYEAVAKLDDRFAELQFHIGLCLLQAGRRAEAQDRFELARDLDSLRFRADSRINASIREVAREQETGGVHFVDAARALTESAPDPNGASGGDIFYEHVHLTFNGNYLLARAVLDQIGETLPKLAALHKPGPIPSRLRCAELLALTPWDEAKRDAEMLNLTSKAPFTHQFNHSFRQAAARQRLDALRRLAATPEAMRAAWNTYEAALAQAPDDCQLHHRFGLLALQSGRPDVAVKHLRIAVEKLPLESLMHCNLGKALVAQGRVEEAIVHYQKAVDIKPDDADTYFKFGVMLASRGRHGEAIDQYRKALQRQPDNAEAHHCLGNALGNDGQLGEAIAHFQKALEIKPDFAAAHYDLGYALGKGGKDDDAISHFQKAVEIKPDYAEAHFNLGLLLARRGRVAEAIAHYQKALQIKPDYAQARQNLEAVRSAREKSLTIPKQPGR